jgi:hypothetical protein
MTPQAHRLYKLPSPRRQRGGMISLLLTLLVIGFVAYFALRGIGRGAHGTDAAGGQQASVTCERAVSDLVKHTGGLGPQYESGYAALPPACQRLLPPPPRAAAPADPDK